MENEEIKKISNEVADVKKEIMDVKETIHGHGKKLDDFITIMKEHAVLTERYSSLEKRCIENSNFNIKDHDEIFKRLREIEMEKSENLKEDKPMAIVVIWDIIKIIIAVLIALLVTGKLPVK